MNSSVILDAGALDGAPYSPATRALIEQALRREAEVWCCAANLAEVCRGRDRTASVEAFLRRGISPGSEIGAIRIRSTDEGFAKRIGNLLHAASLGSESLADAHVVALCSEFDSVVVLTTDPSDIQVLASFIPGVRVTTRRP